jgi:hypothetical protein
MTDGMMMMEGRISESKWSYEDDGNDDDGHNDDDGDDD